MNPTRTQPAWTWPALAALVAYAYLPTLAGLVEKWSNSPQYSHGFLVPFFAAYLLYARKDTLLKFGTPRLLAATPLLAVAVALRLVSAWISNQWLDGVSLLLVLTGGVLVAGGWPLLRFAGPAIGFLMFAIPLPHQVETMMGGTLQTIATLASTFVLQLLGQPALSEGNTILVMDHKLEVANACSGLKMMMTFAAFCCAAVLLIDRSKIEKVLIVLSCVPIAVLTNVLRIVGTGLAYMYLGHESAVSTWLHDIYGWLMMPVGLALLMLELWVFRHLLLEPKKAR